MLDSEKKIIKTILFVVSFFIFISASYFFIFDKQGIRRKEIKTDDFLVDSREEVDLYEGDLDSIAGIKSFQRIYPSYIKSVYTNDIAEFEELLIKRGELPIFGINTVRVRPQFKLIDGEFEIIGSKRFFLNAIKILKDEGFTIELSINYLDPIDSTNQNQILAITSEWGQAAQDLKVEYFLPLDVDHKVLTSDSYKDLISSGFAKLLSEKVDEIFTGKSVVLIYFEGVGLLEKYPLELFDVAKIDFRFNLHADTIDLTDFKYKDIYGKYFPKLKEEKQIEIIHLLNMHDEYQRAEILRGNLRSLGSALLGIDTEIISLPLAAKDQVFRTFQAVFSDEEKEISKNYEEKYKLNLNGIRNGIILIEPKAERFVEGSFEVIGKFKTENSQKVDIFASIETGEGTFIQEPTKLGTFDVGLDWEAFSGVFSFPNYKDSRIAIFRVYLGNPGGGKVKEYYVPLFFY